MRIFVHFFTQKGYVISGVHNWKIKAELEHDDVTEASLMGSTTAHSTSGVATFSNLGITHWGTGYRIKFTVVEPDFIQFTRTYTNLNVPKRMLTASLNLETARVNEPVDLVVTMRDGYTDNIVQNMDWQV